MRELDNDKDKAFLVDGIQNGFKIADIGTNFAEVNINNYKSATNTASGWLLSKLLHMNSPKAIMYLQLSNLQ